MGEYLNTLRETGAKEDCLSEIEKLQEENQAIRIQLIEAEYHEVPHRKTLRDYFAGQALVAASLHDPDGEAYTPKQHAEWAYEIADAMLSARNKGEE